MSQRKQNLSSFDVAQVARELRACILTARINSFTNCSADTYCAKLATSAQAI